MSCYQRTNTSWCSVLGCSRTRNLPLGCRGMWELTCLTSLANFNKQTLGECINPYHGYSPDQSSTQEESWSHINFTELSWTGRQKFSRTMLWKQQCIYWWLKYGASRSFWQSYSTWIATPHSQLAHGLGSLSWIGQKFSLEPMWRTGRWKVNDWPFLQWDQSSCKGGMPNFKSTKACGERVM